jgi:hypothetical protein
MRRKSFKSAKDTVVRDLQHQSFLPHAGDELIGRGFHRPAPLLAERHFLSNFLRTIESGDRGRSFASQQRNHHFLGKVGQQIAQCPRFFFDRLPAAISEDKMHMDAIGPAQYSHKLLATPQSKLLYRSAG